MKPGPQHPTRPPLQHPTPSTAPNHTQLWLLELLCRQSLRGAQALHLTLAPALRTGVRLAAPGQQTMAQEFLMKPGPQPPTRPPLQHPTPSTAPNHTQLWLLGLLCRQSLRGARALHLTLAPALRAGVRRAAPGQQTM